MANLMDYLDWRGDLTLRQDPFNEVDNLILAELSFVDFGGIVPPPGEGEGVSLWEAAEAWFSRHPAGEKIDMGVLVPADIPVMLRKMAASRRFREMKLHAFSDLLDTEQAVQFAALTVECGDGLLYVSFRGTDDTLVGWKEDFHMAVMPEIPAQKLAVSYLRAVAAQFPRRRLRVGGHSKGGNLAVYAAVFSPAAVQRRVEAVWSNDGPGFYADILALPQGQRMAEKITAIVPKSSVVGMLLKHNEDYVVVDSSQVGLMQHDGFSWEILGNRFTRLREVPRSAQRNDQVLKEWVQNMSPEQKERFVDGLFSVLEASGAVTLTDLKEEKLKAMGAMVKAMKDMEKDTRDALAYALKLLVRSNLKVLAEELQQESEQKMRFPRKK